jgi:hypothetical protein
VDGNRDGIRQKKSPTEVRDSKVGELLF